MEYTNEMFDKIHIAMDELCEAHHDALVIEDKVHEDVQPLITTLRDATWNAYNVVGECARRVRDEQPFSLKEFRAQCDEQFENLGKALDDIEASIDSRLLDNFWNKMSIHFWYTSEQLEMFVECFTEENKQ